MHNCHCFDCVNDRLLHSSSDEDVHIEEDGALLAGGEEARNADHTNDDNNNNNNNIEIDALSVAGTAQTQGDVTEAESDDDIIEVEASVVTDDDVIEVEAPVAGSAAAADNDIEEVPAAQPAEVPAAQPAVGIAGCLFGHNNTRRRKVVLPPLNIGNGDGNRPNVADYFGTHRDVYMSTVILDRRTNPQHFLVAGWTRGVLHPRNPALERMSPSIIWTGDVIVFAKGKRVPFLANPMAKTGHVIERAAGMFISRAAEALDAGRIPPAVMRD